MKTLLAEAMRQLPQVEKNPPMQFRAVILACPHSRNNDTEIYLIEILG